MSSVVSQTPGSGVGAEADQRADEIDLIELLLPLLLHWKLILGLALLAGLLGLGLTFLLPKIYTSRTVFLPPQQQQSAAAAALSQLGALSGLAGAAAGVRAPGEQYIALLQSQTVADRVVDAFGLMAVYEAKYRFEARLALAGNSRISLGRKDGLITIEVDDTDSARAAGIANRYVEELRGLTDQIALTEAQQRRQFLDQQLSKTRDNLTKAQIALQGSGFSPGALKADARAATENFARALAGVTAAEIRLQGLRVRLTDNAPEVQEAAATLRSLKSQLAQLEAGNAGATEGNPDYISKFREFKYQETLFELFARQLEVARIDEAREGPLIQVVDTAKPAEWKSRPKRALFALGASLSVTLLAAIVIIMRHLMARQQGPTLRQRLQAARQS